jgi:DNA-binding transcriptional LysR family regulator
MNVHHLELFYYVARHGGISEAVRNIPYGIQQPAVSGQIIQLESFLGVTLFQRRPFALTPPGQELFDFISPFFSKLDATAMKLQGGLPHQIRIGASQVVLREYLPGLMQMMRMKFPKLKLILREASQPQLENWLAADEIDLAITSVHGKPPPGLQAELMLEVRPVLLVRKENPVRSAQDLWKCDKIEEPLIALPPNELVCRGFQAKLAKMKVDWFPSLEVASLALVETYAAKGYGIGLSLQAPGMNFPPELRVIPLPEFPGVGVGVLWRVKPGPMARVFLEEVRKRAAQIKAEAAKNL